MSLEQEFDRLKYPQRCARVLRHHRRLKDAFVNHLILENEWLRPGFRKRVHLILMEIRDMEKSIQDFRKRTGV